MRTLRYIILLLFWPLFAAESSGQTPDSVYLDRHSLWRKTYSESLQNPAMMNHAYLKPFTELSILFDYSKQSEAFSLEQGTGFMMPEISARSYIRLTPSSVVWGKAAYSNGSHYNKTFNNVADFDLLYPDVIADSIGGDTRRERYLFSGGYAAEKGRWLMGGELRFRAEQEYRTTDPRMRSVVSDLVLKAGAARNMGNYRLGASVEGNIYRQTADVDFYGETNGMGELQLTGLGTSYVRFSGSNRDIFYEGKGGSVAIDLQPVNDNGWFAHVSHSLHQYERLSDEYNSMPLTTLYRQQTGLTMGWKRKTDDSYRSLLMHASYDKRASDEHIVGSASGQDYPILTDLTMYKQHLWDVYAAGLYGHDNWHLMARAGYISSRQSYAFEERKMDYSRIYGELTARWLKTVNQTLRLNVHVTGGYAGNVSSQLLMPFANMTPSMIRYINHTYKYQKASYTNAEAGIRADYQPEAWAIGIFGQMATRWQHCSESENEVRLHLSLGIIF